MRSIKLPGEPEKTYRQMVNVNNGKGTKVVEELSNGRVVARNSMPLENHHMNMIANRKFIPGLFKENYRNLTNKNQVGSAAKTRRRKTGRKTRRR